MISISTEPPESVFNGLGKIVDFKEPITIGFWGHCFAVILVPRSLGDNHASFTLLTEDDGNWFISKQGGFSSFWIPEIIELFQSAITWLEKNGTKDPSGYGWRLPNKPEDKQYGDNQ